MPAHTPGPWRWNPDSAHRNGHRFPGFRIDSESRSLMAWLETGEGEPEEVRANARLVASSPDLLKELEATQETLLALLDCHLPDDARSLVGARLFSTRKAIAKATGA